MEESPKPKARWWLAHTGTAATIMTIGQVYYAQQLLFTRKEGEAHEKRISRVEDQVIAELRGMHTEIQSLNINVGVLMHDSKKKSRTIESLEAEAKDPGSRARLVRMPAFTKYTGDEEESE